MHLLWYGIGPTPPPASKPLDVFGLLGGHMALKHLDGGQQ
jgi:hypothetical protein